MSRSSNPLFTFKWIFPLLKEQLVTLHQQLRHWQHVAYLPKLEGYANLAPDTGSEEESISTDIQSSEHKSNPEQLLDIAEQYQHIFTKLEMANLPDFAALTQQLEATIKAIAIQYLSVTCTKPVLDASEHLLQELSHYVELGSYQRQPLLDSLQQLQALFVEAEVIANDTNKANTKTNVNAKTATSVSNTNPALELLQSYIKQLVIPEDTIDCDPEIKDIFLEEAEEVLQNIAANLQRLPNLTADRQALTAIRRGFHTLKGSGRMAGALCSAELAWAVENMLNRVLEGSIEEVTGMQALVKDVVAAYPDLMRNFEQKSPYPQQLGVWMAAANVYAKNQYSNFDYTLLVQADISSVEQASDLLVEYTPADSVLQQVFVDEVRDLLKTINKWLLSGQMHSISAVDDDIIRAFHTLCGAANSQGLFALGEISATIEQGLERLHQHKKPLSERHIQMIGQSVALIRQYIQPQNLHNQDQQLQQDIYQLQQAFDKLVDTEVISTLHETGVHFSVATLIEGIDALLDAKWQLPKLLVNGYLPKTNSDKQCDGQQPISQKTADYFAQLLAQSQVLLTKVSESAKFVTLLNALQHVYQAVIEQPQLLISQLPTEQQQQSQTLESYQEHDSPAQHTIHALIDALTAGHEQLLGLFDSLAGSMVLEVEDEVIERLHQVAIQVLQFAPSAVNQEIDDLDTLTDVVAEKADTDTVQNISSPFELVGTDAELLAIFVEEAQALDEESNRQFALWHQDPQNKEVILALQRHLHTIKGGAHMVGVESIAALSHEAENLYEYFFNQQIVVTPAWVTLMQSVQDIVSAQIDMLSKQGQSFYVPHIIEQLQQLAQRKQLEIAYQLPPLSLPLTVSQQPVASEKKIKTSSDPVDLALSYSAKALSNPLLINTPPATVIAPAVMVEAMAGNHTTEVDATVDINSIELEFDKMKSESWEGHSPDPDVLSIFLEEANDIIRTLPDLQQLRQVMVEGAPANAQQSEQTKILLAELQRALHLLKGGAHMVHAYATVEVTDALQTVYKKLEQHSATLPDLMIELLVMAHTWLAQAVYLLEKGINPPKAQALVSQLQRVSQQPDNLQQLPEISLQQYIQAVTRYESWREARLGLRDISQMPPYLAQNVQEDEFKYTGNEMIRVPTHLMEQMIDLSGESAINRSRIELSMSSVSSTLSEMGSTVNRLAEQLRRMDIELEAQVRSQLDAKYLQTDAGFDPLEMDQYSELNQLSKALAESASDLLEIKATLYNKTQDTEILLSQLAQTQTQLRHGLMTSRMVPFSHLMPRLQRTVRQTASELGKSVQLTVINEQDEIDRTVLESISSPLEHMLRNAVDHGIEFPEKRNKQGKPEEGHIVIDIGREGNEVVIRLRDDGQGIDVASVRRKALSRGLIGDDQPLTDLEVMQYIFHAGLSTASNLTQISGRGVGMDVVLSEVRKLGGSISVQSQAGQGTEFVLRLPLTIAVTDALMVRAGEQIFAIPLLQIERIERVSVQRLAAFYYDHTGSALEAKECDSRAKSSGFQIAGVSYRLRYLTQILLNTAPKHQDVQSSQSVPVILLKTLAGQSYALHVDEIVGSRVELVTKPLGRPLSTITGLSAATITADGSVMLILDALALMRYTPMISPSQMLAQRQSISQVKTSPLQKLSQQDLSKLASKSQSQPYSSVQPVDRGNEVKPKILIVDDSVTVRKVTSRILARQGYQTYVARDGIEALAILQTLHPDVMLLDIEMPSMDGFEVATHVRHDIRLQNLPIIMITSRTGGKHRQRARQLAVNEYMGKPFQEATLISSIQRLLSQRAKAVSD